jgi:hypothetical protein
MRTVPQHLIYRSFPPSIVLTVFWLGSWIRIFDSQSTILHLDLQGTRLSISFAATLRLHRHQKRFHRPPANRSMVCTRRCVQGLNRLPPFPRLCCWWSRAVRGVSRWREVLRSRRVYFTHHLRGLPAHTPPPFRCCCCVVVVVNFFVLLYFWAVCCISLLLRIFCCIFCCDLCNGYPSGVWILRILHPPFTTFTGGPGSWHPCQGSIGPHLRKHCLRVLSFIGFIVFFTLWVAQP